MPICVFVLCLRKTRQGGGPYKISLEKILPQLEESIEMSKRKEKNVVILHQFSPLNGLCSAQWPLRCPYIVVVWCTDGAQVHVFHRCYMNVLLCVRLSCVF